MKGLLHPREMETLRLMALGLSNGEIGERMGITQKSTENYVTRVYEALNLTGVPRSGIRGRAMLWYQAQSKEVGSRW